MNRQVVCFFDVDNTLLDDDRLVADLKTRLKQELDAAQYKRYWEIFEERQEECHHADYLGALQCLCDEHPREPHVTQIATYLLDYPFADRLYRQAIDVLTHCRTWGMVMILSDGDVVLQPRKIEQSGLAEAVQGRFLVYAHKEKCLDDVTARYPADHYVAIDDNIRVLSGIKDCWKDRVNTIFVQQGHFAHDQQRLKRYPPADATVNQIADLLRYDLEKIGGSR
jgi:FMN phosphatase YigB (HAD superfamily)